MEHKVTGETMVVKELITCDDDATKSFLKEVNTITMHFVYMKNFPKSAFLSDYSANLHQSFVECFIVTEYVCMVTVIACIIIVELEQR